MNGVASTVRHSALYYLSRSRRKQLGGLQMKRGRKPMIRTNSYVMLDELTIQPWEWSLNVCESWRPLWGHSWWLDELNEAGLKHTVQFTHSAMRVWLHCKGMAGVREREASTMLMSDRWWRWDGEVKNEKKKKKKLVRERLQKEVYSIKSGFRLRKPEK